MTWTPAIIRAESVVQLMRRAALAIRAIAARKENLARSGPVRPAAPSRKNAGVLQLVERERISADLRAMKSHDPRRGKLTAKARFLTHEILKAGPSCPSR